MTEKYPRFAEVRDQAMVAELEPGDALYLPKLWWHQVEALSPFQRPGELLVGRVQPGTGCALHQHAAAHDRDQRAPRAGASGLEGLVRSLCLSRAGHPLAHLPAERHGLLGPLKDNYGKIRARVMHLLRGS